MAELDSFDKEINALIREERRKENHYYESMQPEIAQILDDFYGHVAAVESLEQDWTIEEITLGQKPNVDLDELSSAVDELLQHDIERLGDLLLGDVHVNGTGEYAYLPEDIGQAATETIEPELVAFEELEVDEYIRGEIQSGSIRVGVENDALIVLVHIQEAVLYDSAGMQRLSFEEGVTVRLDSPALHFSKVIYQNSSNTPESSLVHEKKEDTATFLKEGSVLQDVYNDIENDLNRNEYTDAEHFQARAEAQEQLDQIIMSQINENQQLALTARSARLLDGTEAPLDQQVVTYLGSAIGQHQGVWRVVHGFEIRDGVRHYIAHVLPEDIC